MDVKEPPICTVSFARPRTFSDYDVAMARDQSDRGDRFPQKGVTRELGILKVHCFNFGHIGWDKYIERILCQKEPLITELQLIADWEINLKELEFIHSTKEMLFLLSSVKKLQLVNFISDTPYSLVVERIQKRFRGIEVAFGPSNQLAWQKLSPFHLDRKLGKKRQKALFGKLLGLFSLKKIR